MSNLSRFAEEHGGLTLTEASTAYDLVMAERERCARIADACVRYQAFNWAEEIAKKIRSGDNV